MSEPGTGWEKKSASGAGAAATTPLPPAPGSVPQSIDIDVQAIEDRLTELYLALDEAAGYLDFVSDCAPKLFMNAKPTADHIRQVMRGKGKGNRKPE